MSAMKSLFLQFHQPISIYVSSSQGFWYVAEKKSNFAGFLETDLPKNHLFSQEFRGNFWANFAEKISVKNGQFCGNFLGKFR